MPISQPVLIVAPTRAPAGATLHMELQPDPAAAYSRFIFFPGDGQQIEPAVPALDYLFDTPGIYNASIRVEGTEIATGSQFSLQSRPVTVTIEAGIPPPPPDPSGMAWYLLAGVLGFAGLLYIGSRAQRGI